MNTEAFCVRRVLSPLITCMLGLVALPALAQSDDAERQPAQITERQVELNEEGVRAIIDGDHQKAIAVLSESLAYGEANATYLNLGRAYQKLGNCEEARDALNRALTAPVVDDPPPRVIDKKAKEYLGELDEDCPAADALAEEPGPAPSPDEVDRGGNGLAWASIGVGAAFVGGGVLMHVLATQQRAPVYEAGGGDPDVTVVEYDDLEARDREQTANRYDTIGLSADIAGGALIGMGVVLLLTQKDSSDASSFLIAPTRNGATAAYRISF